MLIDLWYENCNNTSDYKASHAVSWSIAVLLFLVLSFWPIRRWEASQFGTQPDITSSAQLGSNAQQKIKICSTNIFFLALKQLYLYFKTIKFLASDLKTNQETSISPSCKLSKLIAPPVTFTLMPNILHFPSEAGIYLVHSLKPLYFVDISKRDIIYIHFNVRKKLSIFQRAEKRDKITIYLDPTSVIIKSNVCPFFLPFFLLSFLRDETVMYNSIKIVLDLVR